MNPKLIACPVTFSGGGTSALPKALAIARWYQADFHVLQLDGRNRAYSSAVASLVGSRSPEDVSVSGVALTGHHVSTVAEYVSRTGVDLIVVAQGGLRQSDGWWTGVYAADVARLVSCPTLSVPALREERQEGVPPFGRILCPVDFSPASAAALEVALVLAQQSAGRLTLLHVLEGFPYESVYSGSRAAGLIQDYRVRVEEVSRDLRRLVPPSAYDWCEVDAVVVTGVAHRVILTMASEVRADVIVMGLPRRRGVDRLVTGSTTRPVLRRARCPVLVLSSERPKRTANRAVPLVRRDRTNSIASGQELPGRLDVRLVGHEQELVSALHDGPS